MPLVKHEIIDGIAEIGVWKLEEDEHAFLEHLDLSPEEELQLSTHYGPKRCEWLSARYLLHHMSGRNIRGKVLKDAFGKPHLEDSPYHISLSHSKDFSAVIASPRFVGIDIQVFSPKIISISERFMSQEELKDINDEYRMSHIHVYWGAKEALFKLYGKGKIDFRKNLRIYQFDYAKKGEIYGRIKTDKFSIQCNICYEEIDGYMLVWAYAPF